MTLNYNFTSVHNYCTLHVLVCNAQTLKHKTMKKVKLVIVTIFILNIVGLSAQEHLAFKGIPIAGSNNSFVEKLKTKGFTFSKMEDNIGMLKGNFINLSCDLYTVGSVNSNTMWKVYITFDDEISWTSLKSSYLKVKEQYQGKYGKGKSYEFFSKPYYEGDGYELQAISKERCTYSTFWNTDEGNISVTISGKHVAISYEDKAGIEVNRQEKQQVVNNDI